MKRFPDETFEEYKSRRNVTNYINKEIIKGEHVWCPRYQGPVNAKLLNTMLNIVHKQNQKEANR